MKVANIIGWLVFMGGIGIILFTLHFSYNIFTGEVPAPTIIEFAPPQVSGLDTSDPSVSEQIEEAMMNQMKQLLPVEALPQILDLIVWSIGAGILIFGGSQIAGLGVKLIKAD